MKTIVDILMKRDGMTKKEAVQAYMDTRDELFEAISGTSCLSPEEVLVGELGLEPDYIYCFF